MWRNEGGKETDKNQKKTPLKYLVGFSVQLDQTDTALTATAGSRLTGFAAVSKNKKQVQWAMDNILICPSWKSTGVNNNTAFVSSSCYCAFRLNVMAYQEPDENT